MTAVICGLGIQGYIAAMDAIAAMSAERFAAARQFNSPSRPPPE
jgi:hypothetical protein